LKYFPFNLKADSSTSIASIPSDLDVPQVVEETTKVSTGGFKAVYQSKYKHILGEVMHKDNNIENIVNLGEHLPSESDAFQGTRDRIIYPISGVAGRLAVVQVKENLIMASIINIHFRLNLHIKNLKINYQTAVL